MNDFFKSTPLHKEWLILTKLSKENKITQRKIAKDLSLSVAMVNSYLEEYKNKGLIDMECLTSKNVNYSLTSKGEERKKYLNISYLESVLKVYKEAKEECYQIFKKIVDKGYKNILMYGAGEVAEILLSVFNDSDEQFDIIGIIDDDINKIGTFLYSKPIISLNDINDLEYDAILISSYTNNEVIYQKLLNYDNIDMNCVIQFFDEKVD